MKKIFIANWKMFPDDVLQVEKLLSLYDSFFSKYSCIGVIAPPFIFLEQGKKYIENIEKKIFSLAAQDGFYESCGAYTGAISMRMLSKMGVDFVIIGHSERRQFFGDTNDKIRKKINSALKENLFPIVCIGEQLLIKNKGRNAVISFLKKEINSLFFKDFSSKNKNIIFAYEPVWAIGGEKKISISEIIEIIDVIKEHTKKTVGFIPRVLYGGSVNHTNIRQFLNEKNIDGVLVGSASSDIKKLKNIIKIME